MLNPAYDEYSPRAFSPRQPPPRHSPRYHPRHDYHYRRQRPLPLPPPKQWIGNHTTSTTQAMDSYGFNSVDGGRPTESFVPSAYVHRSSLGLGGINPTPPNYLHNNNRYPHHKTHPRVPQSLVTLRRTRHIQKVRSRLFQFQHDKIHMVTAALEHLDVLKRKRLKKLAKKQHRLATEGVGNGLGAQILALQHPHPIVKRFMGTVRVLLQQDEVNRETVLFQLILMHKQRDLENKKMRAIVRELLKPVGLTLAHLDFAMAMKYGRNMTTIKTRGVTETWRRNNNKTQNLGVAGTTRGVALNMTRGTVNIVPNDGNGRDGISLCVRSPPGSSRLPPVRRVGEEV